MAIRAPFGIGPTPLLKKGQVARIASAPEVDFTPRRLIAAEIDAGTFMIERITIGGEDKLSEPISAAMFSPLAIAPALDLPIFKAHIEVALFVRKIAKGKMASLSAAFLGEVEELPTRKKP